MKITPVNIGRFWKRLMFPPDTDQYRHNRLTLKSDMPWEPWLHATVWCATFLVLLTGEKGLIPPFDGLDWYWVFFALVSPFIGFFSVWFLEHRTGTKRYCALWGRMIADAGLVTALSLYQIAQYGAHERLEDIGWQDDVLPNMIMYAAIWFTLTLVWRDARFIIATERLAARIYKDVHDLRVQEWNVEWGDDADR